MGTPLSIVMPVYNEAEVIADVVDELTRDICSRLDGAEIVMVDDGSTDGTPAILDTLATLHPHVRVLHAERNQGHGPSLRMAIEDSDGDWILQLDSDGQQRALDFWELWALRDQVDLAVGVRVGRNEGPHRTAVTAAARWANRLVGGGRLRDVNVPFKLIRREVWDDLRGDIPTVPVAPSLLIAVGASVRGWRVAEVEISHQARRAGSSTVDVPLLLKLTFGALRELIGFRARLRRRAPTERPVASVS